MLTSTASQYLHPDYLQPLPTTLDAKKSPLALLAQTCSNIGKDTTPAKPIIPPLDKIKEEGRISAEKSADKRASPDKRSEEKKVIKESSSARSSPNDEKLSPRPVSRHSPLPTLARHRSVSPPDSISRAQSAGYDFKTSDSIAKSGQNTQTTTSTALKPTPLSTTGSSNASSSGYAGVEQHYLGHPYALDPAFHSAYASALAAHASMGLLKPSDYAALGSVSPYFAYAQVKTATGGTTLVPICRDPCCTNCQLTMRTNQLSPSSCGAGCTQCTHDKQPSGLSLPILPVPGSSLPSSINPLASSLYSHSLLTAAHHGLPFVCNWMSSTEHCGKRFASSEELLQHLRSHTTASSAEIPALASAIPGYGLGLHPHLTPGSLSPNSLHRSYPTSLSPLSSLSSSRYHPYKSGLSALPTSAAASTLSVPPMSPYYPSYPLYGSRLGSTAVP